MIFTTNQTNYHELIVSYLSSVRVGSSWFVAEKWEISKLKMSFGLPMIEIGRNLWW